MIILESTITLVKKFNVKKDHVIKTKDTNYYQFESQVKYKNKNQTITVLRSLSKVFIHQRD